MKLVVIPYELFNRAVAHWCEHFGRRAFETRAGHDRFCDSLDKFFGYRYTSTAWEVPSQSVKVPEHAVAKFHALASPHWRTLIKVYEIREKENDQG